MAAPRVREFRSSDRPSVVALWRECDLVRPQNDPDLDIDRKLAVDDSMFFVAVSDGSVIGTVMAGYDGHRGWINYLAVLPSRQGDGIGRLLLAHAEDRLSAVGCPKVNLQVRTTNGTAVGFYRAAGYRDDDVISLGKRLIEDDGGG